MWGRLKTSLSILSILLLSWKAEAQSLVYQFIDPCTKVVTYFSVPAQGTTIFFLGQSRSFVPGDVANGNLASWINQVYTDYRKITPCSQQSGQITQNQITSQIIGNTVQSVVGSIMSQAQSASTGTINSVGMSSNSSSSGGGTSDAASKNNKNKETKRNKNEKTSNQNQGSSQTTSSNTQGQTSSQSGGQGAQSQPGSQGSTPVISGQTSGQTNNSTGQNQPNSQGSAPVVSSQTNNQNSGGSGNNSGSVGGNNSGNNGSAGKANSNKEASAEEVAATTTMNIDQQNQNSAKSEGGGKSGSKGSKSGTNNPIIVSSDFTTAQNLDKSFTPILNLSMSQSSITGMKSWGTTAMVWFNFKQFALSGKYTKINFSKNGKLKWVHNVNLTGVYTYGNVLAFVGYSGILNAGKYGVTGFNVSAAATLITEDKNTFFSPSMTAFYTKPFKVNQRLMISPELYIISTPLIYSTKDKITTTDRTFSAFIGSGFDYQLTKRFKLNMNYKANMSTNPDFPILSFFLVGSKVSL